MDLSHMNAFPPASTKVMALPPHELGFGRHGQPEPSPQPSPGRHTEWDVANELAFEDASLVCAVSPTMECRALFQDTEDIKEQELESVECIPHCTVYRTGNMSSEVLDVVHAADAATLGMSKGIDPILDDFSTGGTYFLRNTNRKIVGVFKPVDEEPFAANNPKNFVRASNGESELGIKAGIRPGEGAVREVAAFLLDKDRHLAGVPPTAMVNVLHPKFGAVPKVGSFQLYITHLCSAEDMGPSLFPLVDVHAIAMLDIRMLNQDRHPGNILVRRHVESHNSKPQQVCMASSVDRPGFWTTNQTDAPGEMLLTTPPPARRHTSAGAENDTGDADVVTRLVPIDNGMCLPDYRRLEDTTFCWMSWPQARQPMDRVSLAIIDEMDSWADAAMLREELGEQAISDEALMSLHIGTAVLKTGANAGLSLHDIGSLIVRDDIDEPSRIEVLITECQDVVGHDAPARTFMAVFCDKLETVVADFFSTVLRRRAQTL